MEASEREQQIRKHLDAIRRLEAEAAKEGGGASATTWPPKHYYLTWHVVVGMTLGMIGSAVSLLCNVAGASLVGKYPLELIRVYLTFPMGESALTATSGSVLTAGCILYLVTGGLYGIAFHLVMSTYLAKASVGKRFIAGSLMGLGLWVLNFYAVLSWLQPMLLGGNWVVEQVPPLVAVGTHLAFAWTMLLFEMWVRFDPVRHEP